MVRLQWTKNAKICLKNIHDYIALDNPVIAKNVIKNIREKVQILKSFPEIGSTYLEIEDVRILYYAHYRIVYLIVDPQRIDILGVFHGTMELKNYIITN